MDYDSGFIRFIRLCRGRSDYYSGFIRFIELSHKVVLLTDRSVTIFRINDVSKI
jgi:hypothetical protein